MNWYFRYSGKSEIFQKIEEESDQSFSDRDVLIEPLVSGICGSDLSQVFHFKKNISVGHEWVGKVLKVGSKVNNFKEGEIVSSVANVRCGQCPSCLEEKPENCKRRVLLGRGQNSILSSQIILDYTDLIKVPHGLSLEDATLLEVSYIGDCSYWAAMRLGLIQDARVLIFGAGPIGVFSALSFKHRGIEDITLIDTIPWRIDKAKELGFQARAFAEIVLDHRELNSYDLVIDCTGDHNGPGALKVLPLFPKEYGSVVIVGKYYQHSIQEKAFMGKALKVTWVANHKREDFLKSIGFWKDKIFSYTKILTKEFPLSKINDAYKEAKNRNSLKCLLKYKEE